MKSKKKAKCSAARWMAGAWLALGSLAGGASCSEPVVKGQLMISFQTDMSLPKDIDAIRVVVTRAGFKVYDQTFDRLGGEKGIQLPATLGFLAPEEVGQPVSIRLIATKGGEASVRVLREVTTTVPVDRVATLPIVIQFLCDGSGAAVLDAKGAPVRDEDGNVIVKSTCTTDGETCIDGQCSSAAVESSTLDDYVPEEIFGSCFDVSACFEESTRAVIDLATCSFDAPGDMRNVALLAEGDGICGDTGCYVALDDETLSRSSGRITVPPAICEQLKEGKLLGVNMASVTPSCPLKRLGLPTCGPWSTAASIAGGTGDADLKPQVIAQLQDHPVSLDLSANNIYWTTGGTWNDSEKEADGTVRTTSLSGGEVKAIIGGLKAPRDIAIDSSAVFWAVSDPNHGQQGGIRRARFPLSQGAEPEVLYAGSDDVEGIARSGKTTFWTQLKSTDESGVYSKVDDGMTVKLADSAHPFRLRVHDGIVYWTDQVPNGSVMTVNADGTGLKTIATGQVNPRALALDVIEGKAVALYWASFGAEPGTGTIMHTSLPPAGPGEPEPPLFEGQDFPNGIAVDDERVYWTNRGAGTVMWSLKTPGPEDPHVLVSGQYNPGTIAVNTKDPGDRYVYWINEGSAGSSDGKVMRMKKPLATAAP